MLYYYLNQSNCDKSESFISHLKVGKIPRDICAAEYLFLLEQLHDSSPLQRNECLVYKVFDRLFGRDIPRIVTFHEYYLIVF